jgi:hypothetical protein
MKLKLFSDQRFLPGGIAHESILSPFWGNSFANAELPGASYYEALGQYSNLGQSFFELSSLEEADVIIFPGNLEKVFDPRYLSLATELSEKARLTGKLTAGFFWGDCSDKSLPISCDLVFRNSLYRSHKSRCDFAYPNWTVDFVETYFDGNVPIRQKPSKPVIGFCGFIGSSDIKLYTKRFLYQFKKQLGRGFPPPHYTGHLLRKKALSALSNSKLIETNFVFRDNMGFVGQASTMHNAYRSMYVNNMQESDYLFCCRGYGNYSYRFYEVLSAGKIPIFLDTDCVLPYDFEIDWKKYCVWVKQEELPIIAEKIAEFHENLSPQEFVDLQYDCYKIWKEKLSPTGFFRNFYKHIYIVS